MKELFSFVNNEFIPASKASLLVTDLALQRGYGIFDFLKVLDHKPIFPNEHLQRFIHSAGQLRLPIDRSKEELLSLIRQLIQKNEIPNAGIKLILTGGYSLDGYTLTRPNLVITQSPLQPMSLDTFEQGIRLVTYPHIRQMPDVKTIDYLMAIWLQPYIKEKNADDVLYHRDDIITECPRSNFFIVTKDNTLVTPSENILKGVIRGKLLTLAKETYRTEERPVTLEEARTAREAFVTSTTKHIIPVLQIDGQQIADGRPGAVSRQLRQQLDNFISNKAHK